MLRGYVRSRGLRPYSHWAFEDPLGLETL